MNVPSLPPAGPIRIIALGGTVALLAWAVAAWLRRGTDDEGRAWAWAPPLLGLVTMALGRLGGPWHTLVSILAVSIAGRNAWTWRGAPRWLSAIGLVTWLVAMVVVRRLFD